MGSGSSEYELRQVAKKEVICIVALLRGSNIGGCITPITPWSISNDGLKSTALPAGGVIRRIALRFTTNALIIYKQAKYVIFLPYQQ